MKAAPFILFTDYPIATIDERANVDRRDRRGRRDGVPVAVAADAARRKAIRLALRGSADVPLRLV